MKFKLLREPGESGLSLAPGFSRVMKTGRWISRFNGLPATPKPLKRLENSATVFTWLKPGANERTGEAFGPPVQHGLVLSPRDQTHLVVGRLALRAVAFVLALAAFLPAAFAQLAPPPAPALLSPASGIVPAAALAAPLAGVVRSQFTGVDPAVIQQLQSKQITQVRLPMFAKGERTLVFTGREDYGPGRFALTGTLDGISPSRAVLAVWDGAVTLDAQGHGENTVRLRFAGNGGYSLEEMNPAAQGGCGVDDFAPAPLGPPAAAPAAAGNEAAGGFMPAAGDGNLWVDVLACYTPQARDAAGGHAAIQSAIASRIATANNVHASSATQMRLRLMFIFPVSDNESGYIDTDRIRLRTAADGFFDNALATADDLGADLVHLFVNEQGTSDGQTSIIGLADRPGRFGVTKWDAPLLTFAHETGHNLGCRHQIANDGGGTIEHAHEATYDFSLIETARAQTVMWATLGSTMVESFSDPNNTITFTHLILPNSPPIPLGVAGSANNAQYIRDNRTTTVGHKEPRFYVSPGGDGQATVQSPANNLTSVYNAWYFNAWGQNAANPVVVRVAAGNIPAPARIATRSRLEKWGGGGAARISQ